MDIQQQIENKLKAAFSPIHLEVVDETYKHNVPEGLKTHFRVTIVSSNFTDMTRMNRHRKVYRELCVELDGLIKALSVLAFSPNEWASKGTLSQESPPCLGGSHNDSPSSEHSVK